MAMLSLVSIKKCGTRCILVVVDRTDLAQQACQEFNDLLERCFKISISKQKTEQRPEVFQVNNAMELRKYFFKMVEDPKKRLVLTVTLQSFPHLRGALPKELEETTVVMADEVHRSHADKAFSEELSKVLGGRPRLLLFTGTASDRCLRMFGEREGQHFVPFHAVAEETVAQYNMIYQLSQFKRSFQQLHCDCSNLEAVAREQNLEPRLLKAMKALSHTTPAAVKLKAAVLWQDFQEIRKGCSYKPQMLLVCESREMVLSYSEAFKALGSTEQVTVYGAFSGRLQHGEGTVDENSYNGSLHEALGSNVDMHKKSDVLVICDRFETGYDNSAVTLLGIDRKIGSDEKLVQVYSRANRRRAGKTFPKVIDFGNRAQDVERAVFEFSRPRRVLATDTDVTVRLSAELKDALPDLSDAGSEEIQEAIRCIKEHQSEQAKQDLAKKVLAYLKGRKQGVSRAEHQGTELLPCSLIQKVWAAMREQEMVSAGDVKSLEKQIVEEYTSPKGIRMAGTLGCGTSSWALPSTAGHLVTPPRNVAAMALEMVHSSEKQPQRADHLSALQAMKAGLAERAVDGLDAASEAQQRARCLEEMKECAQSLRKPRTLVTSRLQKASFDKLHRLVSWAREAKEINDKSLAEEMAKAGVEEIFRNRLCHGQAFEHQHCLDGLDALTAFGLCPRAQQMLQGLRQLQNLQQLHQTQQPPDLKALLELCDYLEEQCDLKQSEALDSDGKEKDRTELWIFLNRGLMPMMKYASEFLPRTNRVVTRRVLLKTLIKLQEMVGEDQEMVHKDYKEMLSSLAQLAQEVQHLMSEACYVGKTLQRRRSLAGHLTATELAEIRARWERIPEDLVPILHRLGGPDAVLHLVKVMAITHDWQLDVGQGVSNLWFLLSQKEWTTVEWVNPEEGGAMGHGSPWVKFRGAIGQQAKRGAALRWSFSSVVESRKRKAAAME